MIDESADTSIVRRESPARTPLFMAIKRCVQTFFLLLLLPRLLAFWITRFVVNERAFLGASESIARIPGIRGVYSRQAFYQLALHQCGQDCFFGWQSVFSMQEASLGDRVYIGRFCSLGYARIESDVMLADGVYVLSGGREHIDDNEGNRTQRDTHVYRPVTIGAHAWIGAGARVMADVGSNTIIGAGAVVTKPIPANVVAVGAPARVIRSTLERNA